MSSLVCNATHCVFTRIDTNGTALGLTPDIAVIVNGTETFLGDQTSAPWTDLMNQDVLSDTVALTRDFTGNLFNAKVPNDQYGTYTAPTNTEWALIPEGKTLEEARCGMNFCTWNDCFAMYNPTGMIGKAGVVHLIQEDVYYGITFTNWTSDYTVCPGGYCGGPYPMYKNAPSDSASGVPMNETAAPAVFYDGTTTTVVMTEPASDMAVTTNELGNGEPAMPMEPSSMDSSMKSLFPIYPGPYPYPPYYVGMLGGGFSYVRDKSPITFEKNSCPRCELAKASPNVLSGPIDHSFVTVKVDGVTPKNNGTTITIKAVTQDQHPKCNMPRLANGTAAGNDIRPNARINSDKASASLRRTLIPGELNPFRYTLWFDATTASGTCSGQVSVCVPPGPGFTCDSYMGYDATAKSYCM